MSKLPDTDYTRFRVIGRNAEGKRFVKNYRTQAEAEAAPVVTGTVWGLRKGERHATAFCARLSTIGNL